MERFEGFFHAHMEPDAALRRQTVINRLPAKGVDELIAGRDDAIGQMLEACNAQELTLPRQSSADLFILFRIAVRGRCPDLRQKGDTADARHFEHPALSV